MDLRRPHPVVNFSSWNIVTVSDSDSVDKDIMVKKDQAEVSGGAHTTPHHPEGR